MKNIAGPFIKKTWSIPGVIIITTCDIEGGGAPGIHEGQVTNSVVTGSGHFILFNTSGGNVVANHTKNAYYS